GGWNRERRIGPQALVVDERLEVASKHPVFCRTLEANRPIVGLARMPTPSVGVEVVHEVAAAGDQHALLAERRKLSADLKMVGRGLSLIDAELDDGNVGL